MDLKLTITGSNEELSSILDVLQNDADRGNVPIGVVDVDLSSSDSPESLQYGSLTKPDSNKTRHETVDQFRQHRLALIAEAQEKGDQVINRTEELARQDSRALIAEAQEKADQAINRTEELARQHSRALIAEAQEKTDQIINRTEADVVDRFHKYIDGVQQQVSEAVDKYIERVQQHVGEAVGKLMEVSYEELKETGDWEKLQAAQRMLIDYSPLPESYFTQIVDPPISLIHDLRSNVRMNWDWEADLDRLDPDPAIRDRANDALANLAWDDASMERLYSMITPGARSLMQLLLFFQARGDKYTESYVTSDNRVFSEVMSDPRVFDRDDVSTHSVGGWLSSIRRNLEESPGAGSPPHPITRGHRWVETPDGPVKRPVYQLISQWRTFLSDRDRTPEEESFHSHLAHVFNE